MEARLVPRLGGEFGRRGGLHPQIELVGHSLGKRLDHRDRVQAAQLRLNRFDTARQPEEQGQIFLKALLYAGPQHFHRDRLALGGAREMDLRDRRGGDRFGLEFAEQAFERRAEAVLDGPFRLGAREGRHAGLQRGEVVGDFLADQIGPHGERLAELDEAGTERDQRGGEPFAGAAGRLLRRQQPLEPDDQNRRHARLLERKQRGVPGQDARDTPQPDDVLEF